MSDESDKENLPPENLPPQALYGPMQLGNALEGAFKAVGITPERVSRFLGRPCNCAARRDKLNALHAWAARWLSGKRDDAKRHIEDILDDGGRP